MIKGKKFLSFNDKYFYLPFFIEVRMSTLAWSHPKPAQLRVQKPFTSPFFRDEKYVAMVDAIIIDLFSSSCNFLCFTDFEWLIRADLPCMIYPYFYNTVCKTLHEHSSFAQPNISNLPLSIQIAESCIFLAFFINLR